MSKSILAYIVTSSSSFKNIGRKLYANQRKMQQLHCCAPQKFKPVTHVIFDLDGTILDTEGIYMSAIAEIGAEYGKKFTDALRNQVAGSKEQDTASIVVREMGLPMSWEEFLKAFRAKCDSQLPDAEFLPGVVKMIKHLHSHNIPIAVATSSPQDAVDLKSTNKKNIFDLFSHIVCGSSDPEVKQGKPAPDIFLICASRFPDKPDPSKCLVFEDAINGVQGALKAGMQLDGRILNANFTYTAGGVGRNICESLCKLGFPPNFLSVVGADERGKMIMSVIPPQSRHFVRVDDSCNTAECIVVFDDRGSCRLLMGDMKIHNKITPEVILENESIIKTAPLIILDSNLSEEAIEECLKLAVKHNIPVLFEPTDVEPSTKPFKTPHWKAIKFITPNLSELEHIARFFDFVPQKSSSDIAKAEELSRKLLSHGIDNIIVTLGSKGVLVARKGLATEKFFTNNYEEHVRFYPTEAINSLVNVSGAGDCFASGFIAALISNMPEEVCVSVGFAAAKLALKCQAAVPMEIFDRSHRSWERSASYQNIL